MRSAEGLFLWFNSRHEMLQGKKEGDGWPVAETTPFKTLWVNCPFSVLKLASDCKLYVRYLGSDFDIHAIPTKRSFHRWQKEGSWSFSCVVVDGSTMHNWFGKCVNMPPSIGVSDTVYCGSILCGLQSLPSISVMVGNKSAWNEQKRNGMEKAIAVPVGMLR